MMMRTKTIFTRSLLAALALVLVLPVTPVLAQAPRLQPVSPGRPMPAMADVKVIRHSDAGEGEGAGSLAPFNLDEAIAGKVVVFFYWMAGDANSEELFKEVAQWASTREGLALIGVVPPRGRNAGQVAERLKIMKVDAPVIWDDGFRFQQSLRAATVPHMTVLDKDRILRLTGAYNLRHKVMSEMTLESYLVTALSGGGAPTVVQLPRHYPVTELIGSPYKDFALAPVPNGETVRLSERIQDGRFTLLVFWSPDCGHCKVELPELNKYYEANKQYLDLVGVVKVKDAGLRQRTAEFLRLHDIKWPTVDDKGTRVFQSYKVHTTPTTVVVNSEGMIETVMLGSSVDLEESLGALIAGLKQTASASGSGSTGN